MELDLIMAGTWIAGAVIVSGIIQWAKSLAKTVFTKEIPSWVWVVILPVISFGSAVSVGGQVLWNTLGIWAIAQVGYETIIQSIKTKLSK